MISISKLNNRKVSLCTKLLDETFYALFLSFKQTIITITKTNLDFKREVFLHVFDDHVEKRQFDSQGFVGRGRRGWFNFHLKDWMSESVILFMCPFLIYGLILKNFIKLISVKTLSVFKENFANRMDYLINQWTNYSIYRDIYS